MIVLIVVFGVVLYFAERYSLRHVLDAVSFVSDVDRVVVEPGEAFTWTMTIRNGKRMMVPYLKLREWVPEGLLFADGSGLVGEKRFSWLTSTLYLAGRQKVCLSREVLLEQRGRYFFRGASVEAGDFLGVRSVTESYPELKEVVVKPRRFGDVRLADILGGYLGEHSIRKSLMEDPIYTVSFRDYTGREPFRSISWMQSAKHNRLLVKQYDHTTEFSCTVLLNVECESDWNAGSVRNAGSVGDMGEAGNADSVGMTGRDGKHRDEKELRESSISIVRSVCEALEKKKITYDFRTNGSIAGAMGAWRQVPEGLGAGHLETILEGLGRMTDSCREHADTFLEKEIRGLQKGKSVILVTPYADDSIRNAARRLEMVSDREVLLLAADTFEPVVRPEDEEAAATDDMRRKEAAAAGEIQGKEVSMAGEDKKEEATAAG